MNLLFSVLNFLICFLNKIRVQKQHMAEMTSQLSWHPKTTTYLDFNTSFQILLKQFLSVEWGRA
jgi:hypothetical protein